MSMPGQKQQGEPRGHSLTRMRGFLGLVAERFSHHEGPQNAAALTYTTLLSMVPLMTVTLAVFSAFPVADQLYETIQDFVFRNFVPASSDVVQTYLSEFSTKASRLTGTGAVFLVIVALLMMSTIDRALNAIWEVRAQRRFASKFLVYWAVLSLGPVLIGVSVLVTSYIVSLPILTEAAGTWAGRSLLALAPIASSALAFVMLYLLVPNRRVLTRHAVIGGVFAALLFELAKRGFGFYITQFPTYEVIYGALASVPIFLVWLYLSWIVVLLGAEVTSCLGSYRWRGEEWGHRRAGMGDAIDLLLLLDEAASRGHAPSVADLVDQRPHWMEAQLEDLLDELSKLHWVHQTHDGRWALARRLSDATLFDLYSSRRFALPSEADPDWPISQPLREALQRVNTGIAESLDVSLAEFRLRRADPLSMQRPDGGQGRLG